MICKKTHYRQLNEIREMHEQNEKFNKLTETINKEQMKNPEAEEYNDRT